MELTNMYNENPIAHENDLFEIRVGKYPHLTETGDIVEEPLDSYLVINKEFGVVEYCHSVLYFAKEWADSYAKIVSGAMPSPQDVEDITGDLLN